MSNKGQLLQDPFLNLLRKEHVPVSIYLVNGIKLQGHIESFDQYVVLLRNTVTQMVYKHAISTVVPTISVEPPRTPQQMERAITGLVTGRYEWVGFTSVNAVKAVRERFEALGLDVRSFAGLKVAAVGGVTAQALRDWGLIPDLVPTGEQSARGLLEEWPPYDDLLDPINRILLPRADIATDTLVAGLVEMGWEVDDVTAYRTVRSRLHVELDGPQPRRDRGQATHQHGDRLHRPADREDGRGARPARRRAGCRAERRGAHRCPGRSRRGPCPRRARGRRAGASPQ